jgi:hypothetical protein
VRVDQLIDDLGGAAAIAAACRVSLPAVYNWQARNEVPSRHRLTLWRLAKERGLDWRPPGAEGLDLVILPATAGDDADSAVFAQCSRPAPAEEAA